jgi:hypothetical protein
LGTPHTDLATMQEVRRKLTETLEHLKDLGDERHRHELEVHLQSIIDRANADIKALQNIVGPHE